MVCMMSKEQVAIIALLVTLTWACQLPEKCNMAVVPAEPTTVKSIEHLRFKNGTQICSADNTVCTLDPQKASCITDHPYFKHVILAIDPENYQVLWGELKIGQVDMTFVSIAVRDPDTAATVIAENKVLEKISKRCGKSVLSLDYFITQNSSSLQEC
ncbi:hypothetical protein ACOMHN_056807 [Nucella lapillus]